MPQEREGWRRTKLAATSLLYSVLFLLAPTNAVADELGHVNSEPTLPGATSQPASQESAQEGNGLHLTAGVLVREDGRPILCTLPGGPGEIRAIERTPGGTTFVAAERGLFTLSDDVEHLDQLELADGAPPGPVVGVVSFGVQRLWIATESNLACIDPRQGFGRTLGADVGLPPGPYTALRSVGLGELELRTASGPFRYRPGTSAAPELTALTVGGVPHVRGERLIVDHGHPLTLVPEARATGGASFRFRLDRQHLWHPIERSAEELHNLEPGEHTIFVAAWDRNLQRSQPEAVRVLVRYPDMLATDRLPPIALGFCALLLFGFLVNARRSGGGVARYKRAMISAGLLVIVVVQILIGLVFPHGRSWPFVGFTMYTASKHENDTVHQQKLYILRADGRQRTLPRIPGVYSQTQLQDAIVHVTQGTKNNRDEFLGILNKNLEADYIGFLVLDHRVRLTPKGPIAISPIVQCAYPPELFDDR